MSDPIELLTQEQVLEALVFSLEGRAGTMEYHDELTTIIMDLCPALTSGEHLSNTAMLLEALSMPLSSSVIANDVRNLSMKISRALSTLAEGGQLAAAQAELDRKAMKEKKKKDKKKNKKNDKIKVKRAADANKLEEEKGNENGVPMWLSDEAAKSRTRNRDVNINIRMSNMGGGTELINGADLILNYGQKYGLIGKNGIGKSTLLNHISRYLFPNFPKYLHVLHVEQEIVGDATKVVDFVVASDKERTMLLNRQHALELRREQEPDFDDEHLINEVYDRLKGIESYSAPARAAEILSGLGFGEEKQNMTTKSLSGGWRMRVALACALFVTPDILLLDEPTNHLDFPTVMWLTNYLESYEKTLVIVSHDRHFLNRVCGSIIYFANATLEYFRGNYDTFEKIRRINNKNKLKAYLNQQEKIAHETEFINKFRANKKLSSMVQSRIKGLDKMVKLPKPDADYIFSFQFPEPSPLRKDRILEMSNLSFGYDKEKKPLFKNVDVTVDLDSRIGILGANGAGKSTLISLMREEFTPWTGVVVKNGQAILGYFSQHHMDVLEPDLTPFQLIQKRFDAKQDYVYKQLSAFGVKDKVVHQKICDLSGGQKARVSFAVLTYHHPHLIIMDEPTNHLDLETIDGLIGAVKGYKGAIVVVSHDEHFLTHVCEEFWAVGKARIKPFYEFKKAANYSYEIGHA